MAFFALLWKARTIEKYRLNYESEKINSIMQSKSQIPKQSLSQRWRHYRYDTQKRISRTFRQWYPDGSAMSNFWIYLKTDQTFPNFVLKSLLGFIGGIVLTYLCFIFFVFQLSISLMNATIMSSVIGVLLTLGLAFSYRIRCLVFLLIPQFYSRVGRFTLTCYALVLILTGPATNTLKNSEVLSESLACGQEQTKASVENLNLLMTKPLNNLKDSIELMVERLRRVAVKVKEMMVKINRLVLSVAQVIQTGYLWLNSRAPVCNKKLGNPYFRCMHAFEDGVQQCKKQFISNESTMCDPGKDIEKICSYIKNDVLCVFVDHVDGNVIPIIKKRLANFSDRIRHMLFIRMHVHHFYSYSSNTTRTASQVAAGIVTEIRKRADPLLTWLSWSSCVTSLFLLLIIFRAKNYQHMFETRSRFDNRYITKEIRILDLKRLREGRETILPLSRRERAKYVTTTSFRLVASEKAYLNRSIVFMTITTFKLLIHMVADYSLYWVLMTIRYHGRLQSPLQPSASGTNAHISGSGPIADLLKAIISSLNVLIESTVTSPMSCLPNPYPPDLKRYTQIGVLIFLLWFFAMFEPYGLRLRHVIMGNYQPDRAKARAVWLYNHILRTRGGFMKFARRKLHRAYKYRPEDKLTFRRWLNDRIPFCCLRCCLGSLSDEPHCLLCNTTYYKYRSDTKLIRCKSYKCPGVYCTSCFSDIGELCTVCLSPDDYRDSSDVSLEKGSSDESDSEEDTISQNQERLCNLDISESLENNNTASKKSEKNYKNNMFSTTKRDSKDLIPLIKRKNMIINQPKDNADSIIILRNNIDTMMKKVSLVKHRRKYHKTEIKNEESKVICCLYCDNGDGEGLFSCKTTQYYEIDQQTNPIYNDSMKLRKTKHYRHFKRQNIDETKHQFTTNRKCLSNLRNKILKERHTLYSNEKFIKSYPSLGKLIERKSECSFYSITVSENSINVSKIKRRTTLPKFLQKQFRATRKCKMKSRKKKIYFSYLNNTKGSMKGMIINKNKELTAAGTSYSCGGDHKITNKKDTKHNKKPKNKKVNEKRNTKSDTTSCFNFRKVRIFFSYYWKNIKTTDIASLSLVLSSCGSNDITKPIKEKNHKRRKKKGVNNKIIISKLGRIGNDNEETRKYRISAYLAERDWMKSFGRSISITNKVKTKSSQASIEIGEALADIKTIAELNKNQERKKGKSLNICQSPDPQVSRSHKPASTFIENLLRATYQIFRRRNKHISNQEKSKEDDISNLKQKSVCTNKIVKAVEGHRNLFEKLNGFTETMTETSNENTKREVKMCSCATQYDKISKEKLQNEIYQYTSNSCSGSDSLLSSSTRSDASTRCDATVCRLAYLDENSRKTKSRRTRVITKANQATVTDGPNVCDVSTTTEDWWSPIVEKKRMYQKIIFDKGFNEKFEEKKCKHINNKSLKSDGKVVQFRSRAQIIPIAQDVLSPTRYLLESQKYYNELFSSRYYAPHVFPANTFQHKFPISQKKPIGVHHCTRRNYKSKRLEECYSPRKQISPRRKSTLYQWTQTDDCRRKSRRNIERTSIKSDNYKKLKRCQQNYSNAAHLMKISA